MKERPILFSAEMVRAILAGTKTQTRRVVKNPRATVRGEVRADLADLLPRFRGTVALPGKALRASLNPQGAVSVLAKDGRLLGVKPSEFDFVCPYAEGRTYLDGGWRIDVAPGSRLWVRETWMPEPTDPHNQQVALYRADIPADGEADERSIVRKARRDGVDIPQWHPSIFMPRWASRITLEVTEVRVQRVREITASDVAAEGVTVEHGHPESHTGEHCSDCALAFADLWDSINAKRGYSWENNPWVWCVSFRRAA